MAPGLHGHAEVSRLDLATMHWNGWVLTHETGHYVSAAWAERRDDRKTDTEIEI